MSNVSPSRTFTVLVQWCFTGIFTLHQNILDQGLTFEASISFLPSPPHQYLITGSDIALVRLVMLDASRTWQVLLQPFYFSEQCHIQPGLTLSFQADSTLHNNYCFTFEYVLRFGHLFASLSMRGTVSSLSKTRGALDHHSES